ncbi:hypothetical protein [Azospirillum soli]|uniref:hypothetical protein n=1 Tax=Azospirillum soli TaxID=1304799 RepID=UPI001AE28088|nr:hypothetical protein [Azospirillum soli]MBP2314907.1 hypothetical protein [Azospirillum soli]
MTADIFRIQAPASIHPETPAIHAATTAHSQPSGDDQLLTGVIPLVRPPNSSAAPSGNAVTRNATSLM